MGRAGSFPVSVRLAVTALSWSTKTGSQRVGGGVAVVAGDALTPSRDASGSTDAASKGCADLDALSASGGPACDELASELASSVCDALSAGCDEAVSSSPPPAAPDEAARDTGVAGAGGSSFFHAAMRSRAQSATRGSACLRRRPTDLPTSVRCRSPVRHHAPAARRPRDVGVRGTRGGAGAGGTDLQNFDGRDADVANLGQDLDGALHLGAARLESVHLG